MDYDEDLELNRYVWNHLLSLTTDFERSVGHVIFWRGKLAGKDTGSPIYRKLSQPEKPEVEAALAGGIDTYRTLVRERVLAENKVVVNRCPKCQKVVRTPRARQCFWCGFDWHG